jgi:hypothetical protein
MAKAVPESVEKGRQIDLKMIRLRLASINHTQNTKLQPAHARATPNVAIW